MTTTKVHPLRIPAAAVRRFQAYPAYKDANIAWLREIPVHWRVQRLKFAVDLNPSMSPARQVPRDTEVSFVPMEAVGEHGELRLTSTKQLGEISAGYTFFVDGDVILAKITPCFENGKGAIAAGLVNGMAFGTTELHVLRARDVLDRSYLFYATLCDAFRRLGEAEMYGAGGQKRVPAAFVANLWHPIPPLEEQRLIVAFLDRETARIDALVVKNERLIDLLKEKRIALIDEAVTRDPRISSPALEDSASGRVEGQMRKLRHILTRVRRPVKVYADVEYQEIGIRSWGRGIFHKEPVRGSLLDDKAVFRIEPGDFVLNIVFAWEGAVALASEGERGLVGSHRFPTFRIADDVDPDYLLMVFQTQRGRWLMEVNSPGAAGRNKTVRLDQFLDETISLPSRNEQQDLVHRFRSSEQRITTLIHQLHRSIETLEELRTALISAAVTGKIDVREEVA